ncbi:MAG: hypothetical protein JNN04_01530 [Cyclobacteriaceae bacterium]|nr:hypothetical protein [Cyclobacteriaceae bacterium]
MRTLGLIFCLVWASPGWSQLNNRAFEDRLALEPTDSGKLFVGVNALGFFKNNEYRQTIIEGYTLFGYQFQPFLSYHLAPNLRIDAGAFLQKDFGNDAYSTAAPTFTLKWRHRDLAVLFGNLEGSLNHRLIEPLYDFERVLNRRLETGVQFLMDKDGFFADAWFDWQYMQYWNDPRQEQFVAGLSLQKRILSGKFGTLEIPLQLVARHQGGQLDAAGQPIQTVVNTAAGLVWTTSHDGFIKGTTASAYYVFDKDLSLTKQPYLDGDGLYLNGGVSTAWGLEIMATYWKANEYLSIHGGQIYPAISPQDGVTLQPSPHLAMLRFLYNHRVADGLTLSLRYEPYYDLAFKTFQYSYGFYLNYRARYFLANPRH